MKNQEIQSQLKTVGSGRIADLNACFTPQERGNVSLSKYIALSIFIFNKIRKKRKLVVKFQKKR